MLNSNNVNFLLQTKFTVSSNVVPSSSEERCRAGTLCNLQLQIQSILDNHRPITDQTDLSLMYQVVADKHMWAVCGRSTGVVTMPTGQEVVDVSLEVMPLLAGFLPVPKVKLSKYITNSSDETTGNNDLQSNKEKFTRLGLGPTTSRITCRCSTN